MEGVMLRRLLLLAFVAGLCAGEARPGCELRYSLRMGPADASGVSRRAFISLRAAEPLAAPQILIMPRAVPMGYGHQPYDRFVENVAAFDVEKRALRVERVPDAPRWQLGSPGERIAAISYEVDLARMEREVLASGDASRSRPEYVFLLGYSVFAFLEGLEACSIRLNIAAPPNRAAWPLFSTQSPSPGRASSLENIAFADFYALADSQMVMGTKFQMRTAEVKPADGRAAYSLHTIVYAEAPVDIERVAAFLAEAFDAVDRYFGAREFRHFTAIYEFLHPVSAQHSINFSMEHLLSASFCLDAGEAPGAGAPAAAWTRVRSTTAHHVAHAWIPKRAYGEGYFPFSWEVAPLLDTIWFSEGFGQYAAFDALADQMPAEQGAAYRMRMIDQRFRRTLERMPGFLRRLPLVTLSHAASMRYSEDFRIGQTSFARGGLLAAELDEHIRRETRDGKRLRDALRHLLAWSAREKRGFRVEELPVIFRQATGVETGPLFRKWLAPLEE
jgi:predicted metalloprotease with PDZ domain